MAHGLCGWLVRIGFVVVAFVLAFSSSVIASGMRYRLSISYVDGIDEIADRYEDNWEREQLNAGFDFADADIITIPIGLSLSPYYQWDSGLTLGAGIGPIFSMWGDVDHFQMPLSVNVGYVFGPDEPMSLYVRAGLSYHVADGDYVDDSNIGFTAGVGVELFKGDNVAFGIEAAYDGAEVDIENVTTGGTEGVKAAEFSAGLFIRFQ